MDFQCVAEKDLIRLSVQPAFPQFPKSLPLWGVERPENSTVRCFQRNGAGQARGTVGRPQVGSDEVVPDFRE